MDHRKPPENPSTGQRTLNTTSWHLWCRESGQFRPGSQWIQLTFLRSYVPVFLRNSPFLLSRSTTTIPSDNYVIKFTVEKYLCVFQHLKHVFDYEAALNTRPFHTSIRFSPHRASSNIPVIRQTPSLFVCIWKSKLSLSKIMKTDEDSLVSFTQAS